MSEDQVARLRPSLGVILSQFPRYDEAFILRELTALSKGPQELVIFSLRPCRDRIIHGEAKALLSHTVYSPFFCSWRLWASHLRFLRRSARAYGEALVWIFSRHWKHPLILFKTLIFFPKTVHFAHLAQESGLSHLHAGWATYPAASALLIQRLTGIPFSLSGHAHDLYTINPTLAEKVRQARFVLTCTEYNREHLIKRLGGSGAGPGEQGAPPAPPCPIIVSYHGVDLSRFAPAPKPSGEKCRILALGSLLPCKGFETLIESARLLREQDLPFQCTIAGGGPLERRLRERIARYGLAKEVEITGFVSQETVIALYHEAHLCALPLVSRIHWGIPNVLIEALATKTPVICCNLPSLKELIEHAVSGWIVPEQDPQALARAIGELWRNPSLRARLAEEGYRRVSERFSLERTGQALRTLFAAATLNPVIGPPPRFRLASPNEIKRAGVGLMVVPPQRVDGMSPPSGALVKASPKSLRDFRGPRALPVGLHGHSFSAASRRAADFLRSSAHPVPRTGSNDPGHLR